MKLKVKIKPSITKELSWARDYPNRTFEIGEDCELEIGPRKEFGLEMGGTIKLEHLEIVQECNCCCCHCCCKKC